MEDLTKILILEDSPEAMKLIEMMFAKTEVQLTKATTIADAMDRLGEEQPDVILADVNLPDGNSLNLVRVLRDDSLTAKIPIIAISGMNPDELAVKAKEAGCDDFLPKPFTAIDLATRVGACLAKDDNGQKS